MFSTIRKSELSRQPPDRGWPHQVALPARFCERGGCQEIYDFCRDLNPRSRGHSVFDRKWFNVYCSAEAEHAERFIQRLGGEKFDSESRRKGAN